MLRVAALPIVCRARALFRFDLARMHFTACALPGDRAGLCGSRAGDGRAGTRPIHTARSVITVALLAVDRWC